MFEGRVAIYTEGIVKRVRVSNVRIKLEFRTIDVTMTEIPTKGLGQSSEQWDIGAGYLTAFSESEWIMGYGMWHLYFDPQFVDQLVEQAAAGSSELDFTAIQEWINDQFQENDGEDCVQLIRSMV